MTIATFTILELAGAAATIGGSIALLAVNIPFTSKPARGPYSAEQMSQSSMVLGAAAALSGFFLGIAFMSARR